MMLSDTYKYSPKSHPSRPDTSPCRFVADGGTRASVAGDQHSRLPRTPGILHPPTSITRQVFGGQGYGTPADVFSLGVLIWDAFVCGARDNPLCGLSGEACKLRDGLRPPWPPLVPVPPDIERLAERCWVLEPGSRPTAGAVANELRSFAANVGTD